MVSKSIRNSVALCFLLFSTFVHAQDSAVINFTAKLEALTATNFDEPLASGPLAFFAAIQPDILRLDGQIWLQDYRGDGVYSAGFNNVTGNRILIHSPARSGSLLARQNRARTSHHVVAYQKLACRRCRGRESCATTHSHGTAPPPGVPLVPPPRGSSLLYSPSNPARDIGGGSTGCGGSAR